jgi:hypothetical protein
MTKRAMRPATAPDTADCTEVMCALAVSIPQCGWSVQKIPPYTPFGCAVESDLSDLKLNDSTQQDGPIIRVCVYSQTHLQRIIRVFSGH